jgi:putative addiction module killer protein
MAQPLRNLVRLARAGGSDEGNGNGAVARLEQGNLSNVKPVGEGVLEYRINWGPGYRVYFCRDGEVLVILLTGGTKKRQQRDITAAIEMWADYRRRKRGPR